jgi:hypothetical protein
MNMVDFSHNIPSDQLLDIFKNFFEQHMVAYDLLKDIDLVDFKVGKDSSSIFYSVKVMKESDKERIKNMIHDSISITVYGHTYKPSIYLNGDLLCITFNK